MRTLKMGVCAGRHEIPQAETGFFFPMEVDPLNVAALEVAAEAVINAHLLGGIFNLNLYITGLTVAAFAVINAAKKNGIAVTAFHFDRNSGDYYPQEIS
jgi:hypothetical protein